LAGLPGWAQWFPEGMMTDAAAAIFILFLVIAWPKQNFLKNRYQSLLSWKEAERIFQWNVILLLGGSLAMAEGCEISGLSEWIGDLLNKILPDSKYASLIIIMIVSVVGTEVSLLLPC
jgi:di/tricarboxylate transporter